jgi:hypothetical protein
MSTFLLPIQPYQNSYYYVVCPPSIVDNSREISIQPSKRFVISEENREEEGGSQIYGSSDS